MKQTISGNRLFIKKTILPITKQAGIKKVKVKELPAQDQDDSDKMEVSCSKRQIFVNLLQNHSR